MPHHTDAKDPHYRNSRPKQNTTTSKQHTTDQNHRNTLLRHSFIAAAVSTFIAAYITLCILDPPIHRGYLQGSIWRSVAGAAIFLAIYQVINYLLEMLVLSGLGQRVQNFVRLGDPILYRECLWMADEAEDVGARQDELDAHQAGQDVTS